MSKKILSLMEISKEFPGVKALDNVSLNGYEGEAMALLGENGAGKSTLIKILSGIYKKDHGTIEIDGKAVQINTVKDSQKYQIAVIHQELNLLPNMTIAENIFLGREYTAFATLKKERMNQEAEKYLGMMGMKLDPKAYVKDLSIANQQMVEIAKALSMDARIIIMDEPTDALTDKEVEKLFHVITQLKKQGKSIIYISHRLVEIFQICERITVLRDGKYIGERLISEVDEGELIKMMVGRSIEEQFPYVPKEEHPVILEGNNLKNQYLKDVSFELRKGEVFGVAGLVGSGRTEFAKTLYGEYPLTSGKLLLEGKEISLKKPSQGIAAGISYVSEDRKKDGLVLSMSVKENMTLSALKKFTKNYTINKSEEVAHAQAYKEKMKVKTPDINQQIKKLSGGNQQKVSIARSLMNEPQILILDEPTRGIDVGAKLEIYELINQLKKEGKSIIVVSSEMPELLGISDRIMVMHEGTKKGELLREEASQEKIMEMILS